MKSVKYHLRRVAYNASLTYEVCYTLLVQIEAMLNSRPLTPLSTNPALPYSPYTCPLFDRTTNLLTPRQKVIGRASISIGSLSKDTKLYQQFWTRWYKEYLSELHRKTKWTNASAINFKPDVMVLLKEDNLPPLK